IGKRANLTVLAEDPFEVDPTELASIRVFGNVFGGRWHPVPDAHAYQRVAGHVRWRTAAAAAGVEDAPHLCGCEVAEFIARRFAELRRVA
ncbi:MAG: hypothetical protein VW685_06345, partial [Ilumatobacter sp.]